MDGALSALAAGAATALINVLVTDAWGGAKQALTTLWRQVSPAQADRVDADLDEARARLVQEGDSDGPQGMALAGEWQGRLYGLLLADPGLASELRRLADTGFNASPRGDGTPGEGRAIRQHAEVKGGGSAYQAGGDISIKRA
jgi:hypothetical protein